MASAAGRSQLPVARFSSSIAFNMSIKAAGPSWTNSLQALAASALPSPSRLTALMRANRGRVLETSAAPPGCNVMQTNIREQNNDVAHRFFMSLLNRNAVEKNVRVGSQQRQAVSLLHLLAESGEVSLDFLDESRRATAGRAAAIAAAGVAAALSVA